MKKIQTLFTLLFLTSSLFTQTLTLTDGTKDKTLGPEGIFEIYLAESEKDLENDCCNYSDLKGNLTKVTSDSISMKLNWYAERNMIDDTKVAYNMTSLKWNNYGNFAHNDIYSIQHFKSEKSKKRKRSFTNIGALLFLTAAFTAGNTLFIDNKNDRQNLWKSAGVQGGLFLAFAIAGGSKKYVLKGEDAKWKIKK